MTEPVPLTDLDETLLRQVHPDHYPDGVLSKSAFMPGSVDNGKMSTHRERIGAAEAYRRWTVDLQKRSVGTYGVTVGEIVSAGLVALDDEDVEVPDHASVDFTPYPGRSKREQLARKLREKALDRGCLYEDKTA